jgi:hypothetical protein
MVKVTMTDKVFIIKNKDEEFYIDPIDYPHLNLVGGELIDRNDPKVKKFFLSKEIILERERINDFSKKASKFFKEV